MGHALDDLDRALGPGGVLTEPTDLLRYTEPFRGLSGPTPAVVRPASVDQVCEVVRWAREHLVRLLPQGAASGLVGASTPPPDPVGHGPVVVSLERLDGEPRIDPVDRTALVTAGTRLSQLGAAAAPAGLTLPIDLGADPSLGGMVATNTGGARMLRHGDMRRRVLGLRAVVADEHCSVIDELSTLRKHNTGPSLSQLFVGSSGAFGIVTDVAVELDRVPSSRACAWAIPSGDDAVLDVLLHLEHRHGQWLEAFEVVSAEALDAALALDGGIRPFGAQPSPPLAVLIEFSGAEGAEDRLVAALADLAATQQLVDAMVLAPAEAWQPRHLVSEGLRRLGTVLGFDVSVPRPALPAFRQRVRDAVHAVAPDASVADFGHWGDGGMHCNVVLPTEAGADRDPELTARLRQLVLGTAVHDFGGSFSAEHGIGPGNADWWRATVPRSVQRFTGDLKSLFDPLGVLGHPGLPY